MEIPQKFQGSFGEGEILFHLARRMSKLGGSHLVPFQMALFWLINGGDPNHLVTEMIPQEGVGKGNSAIS